MPERWRAASWTLALALCAWLGQVTLPLAVAFPPGDGSYLSAFDHFLAHGARAGVDWVYTYGPLGALQGQTFHPELVWWKFWVWECLFKLAACTAVALCARRERDPFLVAAPLLALTFLPAFGDVLIFAGLLASADLACEAPRSRARASLALGLLVLASLCKNTALFLSLPLVVLLALVRWRAVSRRAAFEFAAAALVAWLATWLAAGQSLTDLPHFLLRSLELVRSYPDGLALEPRAGEDLLGLAVLGLVCASAVLSCLGPGAARGAWPRALTHVLVLFGAFRAGFVRGFDHIHLFTGLAAVALFLAPPLRDRPAGMRRGALAALRWGVLLVVVPWSVFLGGWTESPLWRASLQWAERANELAEFARVPQGSIEAARDAWQDAARERERPELRARVGNSTIDLHAPYQDLVLQNGLSWQPRPVFQSYAATSRVLQDLNAEFLAGPRAPRFYLLRFDPIDAHLTTMEDAALLRVLARDYRPVLSGPGDLLLERAPQPRVEAAGEVLLRRRVTLGERIELGGLPGRCHLLRLHATPRLSTRLRSLVLRPPPLHAGIDTEFGDSYWVRLAPEQLASGAILTPWIDDARDWAEWRRGSWVRSIAISIQAPGFEAFWDEGLELEIVRADELAPERDPSLDSDPYRMFSARPDRTHGEPQPSAEGLDGELVLEVGPSAALYFDLPAGRHTLRGTFGILPLPGDRQLGDGVVFQVLHSPAGGLPSKLLRRELDPRQRPEDAGPQSFELEFEARQPTTLVLRTLPGPRGDTLGDRAYWTRVAIE